MVVGVDIDGVLTHLDEYQLNNAKGYFKNKYNKDIINPEGANLHEIYDCSVWEALKYWIPRYMLYVYKTKARAGAKEFFKYLKDNEIKIVIITSRFSPVIEIMTKQWLKKNNLIYDAIVFCPKEKSRAIKKYNVKLMLEDQPKNINKLKEYVPVMVMNCSYNQKMVENANIIKVNNFKEAINYLENNKEVLIN
jgi:uncharacterized HAD superfamily protein